MLRVLKAQRGSDAGFTLIELLIIVSVVTIITAIAAPELTRARLSGNEASAIGSIRTIASAQKTFSTSCGGGGYAVDLADLGLAPLDGGQAFIPADLAAAAPAGTPKGGYEFSITSGAGAVVLAAGRTCNGSAHDTESMFFAVGEPSDAVSGSRFFGTDQSGRIRQDTAQLSGMTDGIPLQ